MMQSPFNFSMPSTNHLSTSVPFPTPPHVQLQHPHFYMPPQNFPDPPQAVQMQPPSNRIMKTSTLGHQPTTQMTAHNNRVPTSALQMQPPALRVQPQHPAYMVPAGTAYDRPPSGVQVQQPTTQAQPPSTQVMKIGFQMQQ